MTRFASALSRHPVAAHAVGETAGAVMEALDAEDPDLVVCFASPHFVGALDDMAHALGNLLDPGVLLGMTVVAALGVAQEVEEGPAFSIFAARLPDARLTPVQLDAPDSPAGTALAGWPELAGPPAPTTLLLLADPFSSPVERMLARLATEHPGLGVVGGMASATSTPGGNRLVLDGTVTARGAVGVLLGGVPVRTVVAQGARPIGAPFVVTRAEGNLVAELAGRPALARLAALTEAASDEDRALLRDGLHLGIVVDEHRLDFAQGDFLVRDVLGADRETGAIAVGAEVDVGRTVQFHVRDARAADEELRALLAGVQADGVQTGGVLLFTCSGRGRRMFGVADHDASVVAEQLGPVPAAGGFCAGEIGPVGATSHLHAFTASLALFS